MIRSAASWFFAFSLLLGTGMLTGCERDQDVMEMETPEGEVEVEEDADTGALEVEED